MTALLHNTTERQFPLKGQFLEALQTTRFRHYRLGSSAQSNTDATTQAQTKSARSGVRHHDDPRYQALLELAETLPELADV